MKLADFKVGQLLGVTFPGGPDPKKKFGYRVCQVGPFHLLVENVKTRQKSNVAFPLGLDLPNWTVIEEPVTPPKAG